MSSISKRKTNILLSASILLIGLVAVLLNFPQYFNKTVAFLNIQLDKFAYLDQINIPSVRTIPFHLGLDLQGGAHLVYEADVSQIPGSNQDDALESVRDVIERRVNFIGVSEPIVQTNKTENGWRVIVEIPGKQNISQAIELIGATPILEFKEVAEPVAQIITEEDEKKLTEENKKQQAWAQELLVLVQKGEDFAKLAQENSEDPGSRENGGDLGFVPRGAFVPEFDKAIFEDLKVGEISQNLVKTQFGWHIIKKEEERGEGESKEVRARHILFREKAVTDLFPVAEPWKNTALSGKHLQRATVVFEPNTNLPQVGLDFNDEGKDLFAEITERNVGKFVGIFLDGQTISAPRVNEKIEGGSAVITGDFTLPEARDLVKRLNAGALPVPIKLIAQAQVGASLGESSLQMSLRAGVIAFLVVMIFMVLYYRIPGFVAIIGLSIYLLLLLVLFKYIPVTMTLAGIAGVVLSLGMAVDANVLISERLKEELALHKPLVLAIEESVRRAWPAIRDGNFTTLLTCLILILLSSSSIQGFAVTLGLGILMNFFSAMIVTPTYMYLFARTAIGRSLQLWGKRHV